MLHGLIWVSTRALASWCKVPLVHRDCGLDNFCSGSVHGNPVCPWLFCASRQLFTGNLDSFAVVDVPFCPFICSVLCRCVGSHAFCGHEAPTWWRQFASVHNVAKEEVPYLWSYSCLWTVSWGSRRMWGGAIQASMYTAGSGVDLRLPVMMRQALLSSESTSFAWQDLDHTGEQHSAAEG